MLSTGFPARSVHSHYISLLFGDAEMLTFHGILHILSEHVPHDLSADLPNVQLLRKPAQGVIMDYAIMLINILLL